MQGTPNFLTLSDVNREARYGFIEFDDPQKANIARNILDNQSFAERVLRVNMSHSTPARGRRNGPHGRNPYNPRRSRRDLEYQNRLARTVYVSNLDSNVLFPHFHVIVYP